MREREHRNITHHQGHATRKHAVSTWTAEPRAPAHGAGEHSTRQMRHLSGFPREATDLRAASCTPAQRGQVCHIGTRAAASLRQQIALVNALEPPGVASDASRRPPAAAARAHGYHVTDEAAQSESRPHDRGAGVTRTAPPFCARGTPTGQGGRTSHPPRGNRDHGRRRCGVGRSRTRPRHIGQRTR